MTVYYSEDNKNRNLVTLYKALLDEGILEDARLRELAFALLGDGIDELIESIESGA